MRTEKAPFRGQVTSDDDDWEGDASPRWAFTSKTTSSQCFSLLPWFLLAISLIGNIWSNLDSQRSVLPAATACKPDGIADLKFDTPIPWDYSSSFGEKGLDPAEEAKADAAWEDTYQIGQGMIAINKDEAAERGLPEKTNQFPWDIDRSMYLLSGFHSLHCIKKVRRHVTQLWRGQDPLDPAHHIAHCLDTLRQDILCFADDTPMRTGRGASLLGSGQPRMCRSWAKLEEYAQANTACYRYINETDGVDNEWNRYKYCPKDSPFLPNVREYFRYDDDWFEDPIESVPDYSVKGERPPLPGGNGYYTSGGIQ